MRKKVNLLILVLAILMITSLFVFGFAKKSVAKEDKVVSISTGEWAPWAGKKIPNNGFVLQIVREAFKLEGYEVNYKFGPWKRAMILLQRGKVDASAYWYKDEGRNKFAYHSDAVTNEKLVFFYRKAKPLENWTKLEDLKGYKIGLSRGNTYPKELLELLETRVLDSEKANSDLYNFRKLVRGRIDILPAAEVKGNQIIRKEFGSKINNKIGYCEKPLTVTTGHLLFLKKNSHSKEYLKIFNRGLKKLRESGKYDKYFNDLLEGKYSE